MSVVPEPVPAPVTLTNAPLTGNPLFVVTVKVTYVGIFTMTLDGFAVIVSVNDSEEVIVNVPLICPVLLAVAVIVPIPALIKMVT